MKKQLALILTAAMIFTTLPSSVLASSTNRVSRVVNVEKNKEITGTNFIIENEDGDFDKTKDLSFILNLENAKWVNFDKTDITSDAQGFSNTDIKVTQTSDKEVAITVPKEEMSKLEKGTKLIVALSTESTDEGEAKVILDARDSELSDGTYTFAKIGSGSTTITIEGSVNITDSAATTEPIKNLVIDESVAGTIKADDTIKIRLGGNFKFVKNPSDIIFSDVSNRLKAGKISFVDNTTLEINTEKGTGSATERSKISIGGIKIYATEDAKVGEKAEITITGAGIKNSTVESAEVQEKGVAFEAEKKTPPVIYSGTAYDVNNTQTLELTIKELTKGSWSGAKEAVITLPSQVRINSVKFTGQKGYNATSGIISDAFVFSNVGKVGVTGGKVKNSVQVVTLDNNKLKFTNLDKYLNKSEISEISMTLNVSVEPGFVGDITAKLTGNGIKNEQTITIAKTAMPFTVETITNEYNRDHRGTPLKDIVIKEAYAGALGKGTTLRLKAEGLKFRVDYKDTIIAKVTSGDVKIEKSEIKDGYIDITIASESVKTAGTITISDVFIDVPTDTTTGEYKLLAVPSENVGKDVLFNNYDKTKEVIGQTRTFDTGEVTLFDKFVNVVNGSGFTKQIKVTIGAKKMMSNEKEIDLKGAVAYISDDSYTMLPVRAVTEALSDVANVTWDGKTRTVTITFGSRIVTMTIDSKEMIVNGTKVPMSSKAVIKNDWTYVPLRDLGHALGLTDDKITWDGATKTATLN